jgi:hypothetical protein
VISQQAYQEIRAVYQLQRGQRWIYASHMSIPLGMACASCIVRYRTVDPHDCQGFGVPFRAATCSAVDSVDMVMLLTCGSGLIHRVPSAVT